MVYEKLLKEMMKNEIALHISGDFHGNIGDTHFGGAPDVPQDFIWPYFETDTYDDDTVKPRPLSFVAQFNCAELAAYDKEGLLPKTGLLSFFYEMDSQCWGFDPKDQGCAKVYWFADTAALSPAVFPTDLPEVFRFPAVAVQMESKNSLPDWADFQLQQEDADDYDTFYEEKAMLGYDLPELSSKLLGWADIIQNTMLPECALISKGYYLGGAWNDIPQAEREAAKKEALEEWQLLFQLDTVTHKEFELMFGDCGRIYFYIRKKDLRERRFDHIWLILQCY